ncbi:MAG TPA: DUF5667 domain-containing protein [Verrucomicrobiae bacterium]|nr:DUF5667 domain-containing protein [Verrucomicrobiae bacterium]
MMIRYTFWKIARRAKPDAAFVARMEREFAKRNVQNAKSDFTSFALRLTGALSALVLSLGLGTSAYAYSSDDVTPDHPLYPIRTAVENVAEAAAVTPALKAAVQQTMVKRRLHEVQVLEAKHPQLEDKPEGQVLKRVESVLKDGLRNKETPDEIRQKASEAIDQTDLSNLRPLQRLRVERLKSRLENKLPKR